MEIEDIDDLLNRARKFTGKNSSRTKGIKRTGNEDAQVILRNRPVGDRSRIKDDYLVQIYLPTRLPVGLPDSAIIFMHSHRCFVEKCVPERMCHEFGYIVGGYYMEQFNEVWDYLYNPPIQLGTIKLQIG